MAPSPKRPLTERQRNTAITLNKLVYKLSRHWVAAFNVVLAIYVGLPILAPVLMKAGVTGPARAIYTIYSPMCHQMASRSFFLFGEQAVYPRGLAGTELESLESYTDQLAPFAGVDNQNWMAFFTAARRFVGNEQLGYKMALCERDIAIYGFLLLGGLIYGLLSRWRRIRPLPFWAFMLLGLGPIGLDGFTQLFGYYFTPPDGSMATGFLATLSHIFPLRESTPFLRTFTGAWFGLMLAWLVYPHIGDSMRGTEREVAVKLERIGEL